MITTRIQVQSITIRWLTKLNKIKSWPIIINSCWGVLKWEQWSHLRMSINKCRTQNLYLLLKQKLNLSRMMAVQAWSKNQEEWIIITIRIKRMKQMILCTKLIKSKSNQTIRGINLQTPHLLLVRRVMIAQVHIFRSCLASTEQTPAPATSITLTCPPGKSS